jgi:hypothetical protein
MKNLVRLSAIVLLTVFTIGTVTHAANATTMSVAMSPVAMAEAAMGDCDGCPLGDDDKASLCVDLCLTPFVAILATGEFKLPLIALHLPASTPDEIYGCVGIPDPSPPRTIIL